MATGQVLAEGELYTPIEQGRYKGSQRVGEWNYFDHPSEVAMTIDYTKGELIYLKPDSLPFVILDQGKRVEARLAQPCRFHGSYRPLFDHYEEWVEVPYSLVSKANDTKKPISALLTFEVGEEGIARNPKISGDPGVGVPRALMKAFETAPNAWVTGFRADGTPVTCVLGIQFKICVDSCGPLTSPEARILYSFGAMVTTRETKRDEFAAMTNESQGIQYSPDNEHILVETPGLGYTSSIGREAVPVGLITHRATGKVRLIPFSNVNGSTWLNSDQVYFKYSLKRLRGIPAIFTLSTGKVKSFADSTTYFNIFSSDMSRMACTTKSGNGSRVWMGNPERGDFAQVFESRTTRYIPLSWSPKKDILLINGREEGLDQTTMINVLTLERRPVPLFNSYICGWSHDQRWLYLSKHDAVNRVGSIFTFDVEKGSITELYEKVRGLSMAIYSPEARQFAIIMRGDAWLLTPGAEFKPVKVMDGVFNLAWNRTGKLLALVGSKDRQLYEYNLETGQTKKLTDWSIK